MLNGINNIFNTKNIVRTILFATIPALLFYALSLKVLTHEDYTVMEILRDFPQQMEESALLGFLSTIGIWLWVSSAAIAFFTLIAGDVRVQRHKELLFLLGLFSALLAVDDYFLIHDWYIDQNLCYGTYAVIMLAILARHFKKIVEINGFSFFFAGTLLALSIFTDLIQDDLPFEYANIQIVEEGFKFMGIATWLYFVGQAAAFHPEKSISQSNKKKRK